MKNKKQKLITWTILGIVIILLTVIVLPHFFSHNHPPRFEALAYYEIVQEALKQYYTDYGRYPSTDEGLQLLVEQKSSKGKPYLRRLKLDPWDEPYHYRSPGVHNKNSYDLWIYGADGVPGGQHNDEDITNWD